MLLELPQKIVDKVDDIGAGVELLLAKVARGVEADTPPRLSEVFAVGQFVRDGVRGLVAVVAVRQTVRDGVGDRGVDFVVVDTVKAVTLGEEHIATIVSSGVLHNFDRVIDQVVFGNNGSHFCYIIS